MVGMDGKGGYEIKNARLGGTHSNVAGSDWFLLLYGVVLYLSGTTDERGIMRKQIRRFIGRASSIVALFMGILCLFGSLILLGYLFGSH